MKELINKLTRYSSAVVVLYPPATEEDIINAQNELGVEFPLNYLELLKHFNGGELFIPGSVIYGVGKNSYHDLLQENKGNFRKESGLLNNFLIIGETNYGDWLCVNLVRPQKIFLWDKENKEFYQDWNDFKCFIQDEINEWEQLG